MQSFLFAIFDLLFPQRCLICAKHPRILCEECVESIAASPQTIEKSEYAIHYLFDYSEQYVPKLIKAWKYSHKESLLGVLMKDCHKVDLSKYDLLVAVPMHKRRLVERGKNHADLIVRQIDKERFLPGFIRVKNTKQQAKLNREERKQNLKGAFVYQGEDLSGRTILLVDDVVSTGETVAACREVLLQAGALKVDVFCLALNKQKTAK